MARAYIICIILLLLGCSLKSQNKQTISIQTNNAPLLGILKKIEQQTDYSFVYNETLNLNLKRSISITDYPLDKTLYLVFNQTNINWKIMGNHILLSQKTKQDMIIISGHITDSESGETLIGGAIVDKISQIGNISNSYGYYTLQVPRGKVKLQASYIGYNPVNLCLNQTKDTIINFELNAGELLPEVIVTDKKQFSPSGSSFELSGSDIGSIPSVFGETDVLKSLQYIPGIQSGIEGSVGMYVRGGGTDQNLVLLDGVPVYNTGHAFGTFSIFNGDAVKKVSLHKGSFPARFGGRLSSVVDIRLKDGDMQNYHAVFNISLLSTKLNVEGPIIKGKTSFNFSARRSYADAFTRIVDLFVDESIPVFYIYDINAKINHKFSDKSRLYFSVYNGKDKIGTDSKKNDPDFKSETKIDYNWGNTVASLRWNYIISNKLFVNTTVAFNKYRFDYKSYESLKENTINNYYENFQHSEIKDLSANGDFEYSFSPRHTLRFGGGIIEHSFNPEVHGSRIREIENEEEKVNKTNNYLSDKIKAEEAQIYLEDEFPIFKKLMANLGLHGSLFNVQGEVYTSLQPRISLGYEINNKFAVKSSYTKMNQYINLLTSNTLSQPTDLWVPITKRLKPMKSIQYTFGIYYSPNKDYNISVETFYKDMHNILEYKDGASWKDSNTSWEDQVEAGKGWAYGFEFLAQKSEGRFTGWLGYTLAWNNRKFETINKGNKFPAKYDRRHNISLTLSYILNPKVTLSSSWMYATGNNATLSVEEYQILSDKSNDTSSYNDVLSSSVGYIEKRNNYRLPSTHHLDLNMNYRYSERKAWTFTIYNVYNRANPYIIYPGYSKKNNEIGKYKLFQYSLFRLVPSVAFTYKFK
ncbi:MAG: TonB-dependent receptor [Dysgonomonas sp.]